MTDAMRMRGRRVEITTRSADETASMPSLISHAMAAAMRSFDARASQSDAIETDDMCTHRHEAGAV